METGKIICVSNKNHALWYGSSIRFLGCVVVGNHKCLVGLFGSKLFGTFDGIADGRQLRLTVEVDAALIFAPPFAVSVQGAHYLESDLLLVLLPPVAEFSFEIPVGLGNLVNIKVGAERVW